MSSRDTRDRPLTRSEIARAALDLVDRHGVEAFSMRRLADALGVTPMAFYKHFRNKAEVLQAAADQVWLLAMAATERHEDPAEDIVQGMLTVRRTFNAHPEITSFAVASPATPDSVDLLAAAMAARLEDAGFHGDQVGRAYHLLATYTLGSAMLHARRMMVDRAIRFPVSDVSADTVNFGDGPTATPGGVASVRQALDPDPDLSRFEQGARDLLAGLLVTARVRRH